MRVKIYWIDEISVGRLGIMPRPRGGDWLEDEVRSLKESGVNAVVSLLEASEIEELDIEEEAERCRAYGLSYLSFPIPDRSVPYSKADTLNFARTLFRLTQEGKSVVIHCRQGVGRSALIAACVMIQSGVDVEGAFSRIEKARGCSVPDTTEQRDWVAQLFQ